VQGERHAFALLMPLLQAGAAQKRGEHVARQRLLDDLALERLETLAQHAALELAIDAGLAILQTQRAHLKFPQQLQMLEFGVFVDAVAVGLAPALQKPELVVMKPRPAR